MKNFKHPCPYHDTLKCRMIQLKYYFKQLMNEIFDTFGGDKLISWLNKKL